MNNVKQKYSYLKRAVLLSAFLVAGQGSAMAMIIDFESISAPDDGLNFEFSVPVGQQYITPDGLGILTQGFNYAPGPINVEYGGEVYNDIHIQNAMIETGGGLIAPFNETTIAGGHDDTILSKADGSVFNLFQFDFAGYTDELNPSLLYEEDLTIIGTLFGGGDIEDTCVSDGSIGFQTCQLAQGEGWYGLTSVTFQHSGTGTYQGAFALDNIQVSVVPVPAAVWLFGSGLLGLVGVARRNERKQ